MLNEGTGKTSVAWGVASILKGVGIRFDGTKRNGVSSHKRERGNALSARIKKKEESRTRGNLNRERNLTFLIVDKNHTVARFPFLES